MQVLLLRYLCLVTNTANVNESQTNFIEPTDTSALENQPSPAYSETNLLLTSQIEARWCEACKSKEFLCKEMEYNFNGIKFCDLLVQKHKFKTSLNDRSACETAEILSKFENDIDASIKSVLNAFEETRDACCTQLQDDHFASIRVFNIYKAAQVGQIAKCDALKSSSFATYGDIEKLQVFFRNFQNRYVYDCVKLKIFDFAESIVLFKNFASYIKFLVYQLSNPSLKESSSTDIEDARDDTLKENESTMSNPPMKEPLSTNIDDISDDTLKDNESVITKPSMKEPLSTDIEDASDDTVKENESTLSNPSVEEPLTTNIDDASDDTLKDNESSKSNPPMKDPLSKDFENARDDNLAENENTFSNPSMGEPLITDFEKEGDDNSKDNESTMFNPSVEESLITEFEDARDDNSEDNEGSTSSSNNSWVYVK